MKRDIDLARQLLTDIENRGADCSVSVLRSNPDQETEERVRYHLRLLIDAGLLKEVDRTSTGIPCLRLTHEGHELLELARHEGRWRDAKAACFERTGGLSLSVIRHWLIRTALRPRYGRRRAQLVERRGGNDRYRPNSYYREGCYQDGYYQDGYYRDQPGYLAQRRRGEPYRVEAFRYDPIDDQAYAYDDRDWWIDEETPTRPVESRYVHPRSERRNGWRPGGIDLDGDGQVDLEFESKSPDYLI